jgi:hypothetical protein
LRWWYWIWRQANRTSATTAATTPQRRGGGWFIYGAFLRRRRLKVVEWNLTPSPSLAAANPWTETEGKGKEDECGRRAPSFYYYYSRAACYFCQLFAWDARAPTVHSLTSGPGEPQAHTPVVVTAAAVVQPRAIPYVF